jgi:GDP-4-dehydro-6-deoxy-D-mannose reductase
VAPSDEITPGARVLITGITGFAGSHLAEFCLASGCSVSGFSRDISHPHSNLNGISDRLEIRQVDISDESQVRSALDKANPDLIFHLAAATGAQEPLKAMFNTNVLGSLNVLDAAASLGQRARVLVASSSALYGAPEPAPEKITEETPPNPVSAYGLSKSAQDAVALNAGRRQGNAVIVARAFNHTGPREHPHFLASKVARQIALAEIGRGPQRILIGRMDAIRDFSDVRDIVEGYYLAATRGKPGEAYNLASGKGVRIQSIVERLRDLAAVKMEVLSEDAGDGEVDVPCQVGDASKASAELGWKPKIPLDQTLADLLDYWRVTLGIGLET